MRRPLKLFDLNIMAIEPDNLGEPITFLAEWVTSAFEEGKGVPEHIWTADTAYPSIKDAYENAVLWAMRNGPSELCHQVIQLNGVGYE